MKTFIKTLILTSATLSLAAIAPLASAQNFPNKNMTMIIAFPAGGASDVQGRIMAKAMSDALGQPVIVENVVGVGGSLGVVKASNASDGYTMIAGSPLELIYAPLGVAAAKNKPEDMRMVARVGSTSLALVVRKDLPVNDLAEFAALAKKSEKPLSFGSAGIGSLYHLVAERALQIADAKGLHAPYNGLAPYLKDLAGGVLDFAVVPLAGPVLGLIDSGQIKALAMSGTQPIPRFPKLQPAKNTKGFEDFLFSIWLGVQVSAKTPDAQVQVLHKAAYTALANPETRKSIEAGGSIISEPMTLPQLDAFYKNEARAGAAIAKAINLQAQ